MQDRFGRDLTAADDFVLCEAGVRRRTLEGHSWLATSRNRRSWSELPVLHQSCNSNKALFCTSRLERLSSTVHVCRLPFVSGRRGSQQPGTIKMRSKEMLAFRRKNFLKNCVRSLSPSISAHAVSRSRLLSFNSCA